MYYFYVCVCAMDNYSVSYFLEQIYSTDDENKNK